MDLQQFKYMKTFGDIREAVKKTCTRENYDAKALSGDPGWSVTETIEENDRGIQALVTMYDGVDHQGERLQPGPGGRMNPQQMKNDFKLHVITRQGCDMDSERNKFEKHPGETGCIEFEEKPVPGDIIRVRGDKYERDPISGKKFDASGVRNAAQLRGHDIHEYFEYVVDENHCITVSFQHARELLSKWGHRIAGPREWRRWNTNIKNHVSGQVDKEGQVRITNWRFKEVNDDFTIEKPKPMPPAPPKDNNKHSTSQNSDNGAQRK
jgi:hypothetical protein